MRPTEVDNFAMVTHLIKIVGVMVLDEGTWVYFSQPFVLD